MITVTENEYLSVTVFFITVWSSTCNFAEYKPRAGRKRAHTVKIFNEKVLLLLSKFYITDKHENFPSKNFTFAI